MDTPPAYVIRKLISKYNKDLKISGHSKMKKDQLIALIKTKKYHFMKMGDEWDIMPNAEMKRQSVYGNNKKTKTSKNKTKKGKGERRI